MQSLRAESGATAETVQLSAVYRNRRRTATTQNALPCGTPVTVTASAEPAAAANRAAAQDGTPTGILATAQLTRTCADE